MLDFGKFLFFIALYAAIEKFFEDYEAQIRGAMAPLFYFNFFISSSTLRPKFFLKLYRSIYFSNFLIARAFHSMRHA